MAIARRPRLPGWSATGTGSSWWTPGCARATRGSRRLGRSPGLRTSPTSPACTAPLPRPTRTSGYPAPRTCSSPTRHLHQPQIAAVGASVDTPGHTARTWRRDEMDRAVTEDQTGGLTRLVLGRGGRIAGATIVGPGAGETLTELTLAIRQGPVCRRVVERRHRRGPGTAGCTDRRPPRDRCAGGRPRGDGSTCAAEPVRSTSSGPACASGPGSAVDVTVLRLETRRCPAGLPAGMDL